MSSVPAVPFRPLPLAAAARPGFLRSHLWLPLLLTLAASAVLMGMGGDQWLADQFYRLEGHHWALQNARSEERRVGKECPV